MLVAARVFLGQRVNLQEKYDYPIAKSLNALQGGFRNTDTKNLQVFAQAVREHVEQAARVVASIRALVTPHKEKS